MSNSNLYDMTLSTSICGRAIIAGMRWTTVGAHRSHIGGSQCFLFGIILEQAGVRWSGYRGRCPPALGCGVVVVAGGGRRAGPIVLNP